MKKIRFLLSALVLTMAVSVAACSSPLAPDCDEQTGECGITPGSDN